MILYWCTYWKHPLAQFSVNLTRKRVCIYISGLIRSQVSIPVINWFLVYGSHFNLNSCLNTCINMSLNIQFNIWNDFPMAFQALKFFPVLVFKKILWMKKEKLSYNASSKITCKSVRNCEPYTVCWKVHCLIHWFIS